MTRVRVAIVDSGVDAGHPLLRDRVTLRALPSPAGPADRDELGHGTAVAATLLQFAPPQQALELVSVRVFGREPSCDFGDVVRALHTALDAAPAFVNLSLGTTSLRFRAELGAAIERAAAAGTRIVAPATYGGLACDPGSLPGIEAVVADANVLPLVPELRPWHGRLLWFASPLPPKDQDGVRRLVARGESLACAAVTGFLSARGAAAPR